MMPRPEDYANENKKHGRSSRVMKKTKIPSQHKTSTHPCSQCTRKDAQQYQISEKESRWLCPVHYNQFMRKNNFEKPHFIKASVLKR